MPLRVEAPGVRRALENAETRRALRDFVRRRVADRDVEDVVQTVLVEALASNKAPEEPGEIQRWLLGIARHKVADLHRKSVREQPAELPDLADEPAPVEERELLRWAEKQAGQTRQAEATLRWMAREGEGDKLEHIAAEENVPAARVRQRVSRMRRWMKERWVAELALVATLGVLSLVAYRLLRDRSEPISRETPELPRQPETPAPIAKSSGAPPASALERGRRARIAALERCERGEHTECLRGLDEAARLDPEGDRAPEVQGAREAAKRALEAPTPKPSSAPVQKSAPEPMQKPAPKSAPLKPQSTTAPPMPTTTGVKPSSLGLERGSGSDFGGSSSPSNAGPGNQLRKKSL
jgi:DNA-directed RNA polymerase specialized sigma24 family protein